MQRVLAESLCQNMASPASTEFPGAYSAGVTPLPIPNRAVKPRSADGTALRGGRVGRCQESSRAALLSFGSRAALRLCRSSAEGGLVFCGIGRRFVYSATACSLRKPIHNVGGVSQHCEAEIIPFEPDPAHTGVGKPSKGLR